MKNFLTTLNCEIALHAATNLLLCIGAIALFGFVATLHIYLAVPALAFLCAGWFLLYRIELGWRARVSA